MLQEESDKMRQIMGLWMKHQPVVAAYVSGVVRDRHHAEDIVQEVASIISIRADKFEVDRPFLPWALGITHNLILKYLRSCRRDRLVFDENLLDQFANHCVSQADIVVARKAALHHCMAQMAPDRKQLLEYRYFNRTSVQEIARKIDRTEGAVSMLLLRARKQLANCIRKRIAIEAGEAV